MSAPMTEQGPSTVTDPGNRALPLLPGHQRCAIHTRTAQGRCVDVHGMPDGLGDHHRQPAALYFDRLAATVEQLGVLRQVIALADDAPTITDQQLRARLLALIPSVQWRGPHGERCCC
jgi:hypothetical protein